MKVDIMDNEADEVVAPEPKRRGPRKGEAAKRVRAASLAKLTPRSRLKELKQSFVQEEILSTAAALIAARGFRAVTMDDISASMGFTKSVVYYYLKSKNDILWKIFGRIFDAYFETLNKIAESAAGPDEKMTAILRQHALNVMTHRDWTAITHREESELSEKQRREIKRKRRQYDAVIEGIYQDGVQRGLFQDIPPHIAVAGLLGSINWLYMWYNPEGPTSAEEIADYFTMLLSNGFRNPKKS